MVGLEAGQADDGTHVLAGLDLHSGQVDDRQSLRLAARLGKRVDLRDEDPPAVGEEEDVVVGVGHQQVLYRVFFAGQHGELAAASAALASECPNLLPLDVAPLGERDHHVLRGDQVFVGELAVGVGLDACLALVAVLAL